MSLRAWLGMGHEPQEEGEMPPEVDEKEEQEPQFVTKEEHSQTLQILQSLQQNLQTLSTGFNALAADKQARQQAPAEIEDVTDEEIEEALQSGAGAAKFRKMVNAASERVKRDVLGPELQAGYQAVIGLTREVAAAKMPYYDRYKKEIDEFVGTMRPTDQMKPESLKAAHDYVVGLHVTEILNEQTEAIKRQANDPAKTSPGERSGSRGAQKGQATEFNFSDENRAALEVKGYTPDLQAQRMGYKDWNDYMTKTQDIEI